MNNDHSKNTYANEDGFWKSRPAGRWNTQFVSNDKPNPSVESVRETLIERASQIRRLVEEMDEQIIERYFLDPECGATLNIRLTISP